MQILILNSVSQTVLFAVIFLLALLISLRKKVQSSMSPDWTNELKGLAILAIVFGHIGYFLSTDSKFLYPLSTLAGVGVNAFLLLSGFGLTLSEIAKPLSPLNFYQRRLKKLYLPLWLILIIFYILDFLIHQKTYTISSSALSFLGIFPKADPWQTVDSPLWYFTLILFYYLIFPWIFKISSVVKRAKQFIAPVLLFLMGWLFVHLPFNVVGQEVQYLYSLHFIAFPLGVFLAFQKKRIEDRVNKFNIWLKTFVPIVLFGVFAYLSINSGVGTSYEQYLSILTVLVMMGMFLFKPFKLGFLSLVGIYSYEIYLLHWPLLTRYEIFYSHFPAGIATAFYIVLFLGSGYLLHRILLRD